MPRAARSVEGYERVNYPDVTTNLGGPVMRDRLWFFGGYQHLRDSDTSAATRRRFRSSTRCGICCSTPRCALRAPTSTRLAFDREVGRRLALAIAYIRKDGSDFIGWTD